MSGQSAWVRIAGLTHSQIGDTDNKLRDVPVEIHHSILPVKHHGSIHSQSCKFSYACQNYMTPIFYQKLIRDRIPEIIKQSGKTPQFRTLGELEYRNAVGTKILEEAHELFAEWQRDVRQYLPNISKRSFDGSIKAVIRCWSSCLPKNTTV
ncbi:MAG: hypothetical protein AB7T22_15870 [Calditrichaceae bacterium]